MVIVRYENLSRRTYANTLGCSETDRVGFLGSHRLQRSPRKCTFSFLCTRATRSLPSRKSNIPNNLYCTTAHHRFRVSYKKDVCLVLTYRYSFAMRLSSPKDHPSPATTLVVIRRRNVERSRGSNLTGCTDLEINRDWLFSSRSRYNQRYTHERQQKFERSIERNIERNIESKIEGNEYLGSFKYHVIAVIVSEKRTKKKERSNYPRSRGQVA